MKHIIPFTLFLMLGIAPLSAQTLTTYTASSAPGEWQSITQTGTLLASVTGDYGTQTLALPFDFMFGQSDYPQGTTITVRADGFVVMRGSSGGHAALNYWSQPSSSIISPFPLKDGQLVGAESGCWWQLLDDDSGDPMLVIEWRGLHRYPSYPVTSAEIMQLLVDVGYNTGTTMLISTHDFMMIDRFPARVVVCENGTVVDTEHKG